MEEQQRIRIVCDNHSNERQSRDGDVVAVVVKAEHEMRQGKCLTKVELIESTE